MKKTTTASLLAIFLAGCAGPQPLTPEQTKMMVGAVCNSPSECTIMWQRAQLWLANNSIWRIQLANDTLLQTFGPGSSNSTELAYTITKTPIGGDKYQIRMRAGCDNIFGCLPKSAVERIIEFNTYLSNTP